MTENQDEGLQMAGEVAGIDKDALKKSFLDAVDTVVEIIAPLVDREVVEDTLVMLRPETVEFVEGIVGGGVKSVGLVISHVMDVYDHNSGREDLVRSRLRVNLRRPGQDFGTYFSIGALLGRKSLLGETAATVGIEITDDLAQRLASIQLAAHELAHALDGALYITNVRSKDMRNYDEYPINELNEDNKIRVHRERWARAFEYYCLGVAIEREYGEDVKDAMLGYLAQGDKKELVDHISRYRTSKTNGVSADMLFGWDRKLTEGVYPIEYYVKPYDMEEVEEFIKKA